MFVHFRRRTRRGLAALLSATLLSAGLLGLAGAGAAWSATAPKTHGLRTCTVSDLHVSMGRKGFAAGSVFWPIRFTNTSGTSCALRGFPGVSDLDRHHRQIGPAASRTNQPIATVRVTPGHTVFAVIRTTNGPIGGHCLRTSTFLRIFPPASHTAVVLRASWRICSGIFQVGPVNTQGTF
ncbi:DUF4232 domain-containing protein [Streptomyces sp. NPDC051172]|uniref:DUF4232 domain-containing protein n=1 Tax=Streptomyces sp. NPDC051172 TaxID=3155796 RepID=UPI003435AB7C